LVQNSRRREQRTPTDRAEPLPPDLRDDAANPHEEAVSNEEESLVWRTLEAIPSDYREPMILFYREGQSAQSVAVALDLTEDAVWQRLSRGRAMLRTGVEQKIESALRRSKPGPAFPAAVLAALPTMAAPAKLAALGGAAKSAATLGSAGSLLGLLGWFSWLRLLGLSRHAYLQNVKSPRERQWMLRKLGSSWWRNGIATAVTLLVGLALFNLPPSAISWARSLDPLVKDLFWAAGLLGFALWIVLVTTSLDRQRRQIQIEDGTWSGADWADRETPRNLLPAQADAESNVHRARLLTVALILVYLVVTAIQNAIAGRWNRAAFTAVLLAWIIPRIIRNLRRMRRMPRFGFGLATQANGVINWGVLTLIIYNFRHRAVWTGAVGGLTGVIAFNVGVILVYAAFVWILARALRNSK